jgi:hypothetical protein
MKTIAFAAGCVVFEHPEGESHFVGFADRQYDTQVYLTLQRAFAFDDQDVATGMDTYHVEWCDQENSGYGGIRRFALGPDGAEVILDEQATDALDGLGRISISFELGAAEHARLARALRAIFADSDCLST